MAINFSFLPQGKQELADYVPFLCLCSAVFGLFQQSHQNCLSDLFCLPYFVLSVFIPKRKKRKNIYHNTVLQHHNYYVYFCRMSGSNIFCLRALLTLWLLYHSINFNLLLLPYKLNAIEVITSDGNTQDKNHRLEN